MIDDTVGSQVRRAIVALGAALLLGACASAPPTQSADSQPAPASPAAPASAQARPSMPPPGTTSSTAQSQAQAAAPDPTSPTARPQSAKLTLEAVDQLQNGEEALARTTLQTALALDPNNELARKLQDQIRADAQSELGATHFRYTVQKDDTLSKLAQLYMGDRYRFYILAKYNDISNPSRVAAGQVIRIPGRQPAATATPIVIPSTPEPAPAPALAPAPAPAPRVAEPEPKSQDDLAALLQKGGELERAGNLEGAFTLYGDAAQRNPGHADLGQRRDAMRARLLTTYDREATQAFQRQNLDLAIVKWDRILELEPTNRKARLERERALDLKRRMAEKFGKR